MTVASTAMFAYDISKGSFYILVDSEIMQVTAVTANTFTITRAQSGTTNASHANGAFVMLDGISNSSGPAGTCDICAYDTHCVAGTCVPNAPNGSSTVTGCSNASPGPDLVVAPPCIDTNGYWHFPVCNRGSVTVNSSSIHIGLYDTTLAGHMDWYPGCATDQSPANPDYKVGSVNLGGNNTIPPGSCLDLNDVPNTANYDTSAGGTTINRTPPNTDLSHTMGVMVNWDKGINECNYCNNWGIFDAANAACIPPNGGGGGGDAGGGGGPGSMTYNQTYTASCPSGTRGQWSQLAYSVTTSGSADVKFEVQTGPSFDGGNGPWTPAAPVPVADAPVDHPDSCSMTGPTPCGGAYGASCACPIDIFTPLGGIPNAQQPELNLTVVLNSGGGSCGLATTSDGTNSGCSGGSDVGIGSCTTNADCEEDFHCSAGTCVWSGSSNYFDPNCKDAKGNPAVDLTIGVPCATGTGYMIPICNRGGGTLASGTVVALENDGNGGAGAWNCSTTNPPNVTGASKNCTYTLPYALGPGQCIDIDTTTLAGSACSVLEQGHRDLYINWDKSVTECGTGFSGTGAGCMNNSSNTKATGMTCPPACAPPPQPPQLNSWQVTYDCVTSE
jgi:hypothetical protein